MKIIKNAVLFAIALTVITTLGACTTKRTSDTTITYGTNAPTAPGVTPDDGTGGPTTGGPTTGEPSNFLPNYLIPRIEPARRRVEGTKIDMSEAEILSNIDARVDASPYLINEQRQEGLLRNTREYSREDYNREARPIEEVNGVKLFESRSALKYPTNAVKGTLDKTSAFGGWLENSIFGIAKNTYAKEDTEVINITTRYSYGTPTGTAPSDNSGARWEGAVVGETRSNDPDPVQGKAIIEIDDFITGAILVMFEDLINLTSLEGLFINPVIFAVANDGTFSSDSGTWGSVEGAFYGNNYEEVGGIFTTDQMTGAFGARRLGKGPIMPRDLEDEDIGTPKDDTDGPVPLSFDHFHSLFLDAYDNKFMPFIEGLETIYGIGSITETINLPAIDREFTYYNPTGVRGRFNTGGNPEFTGSISITHRGLLKNDTDEFDIQLVFSTQLREYSFSVTAKGTYDNEGRAHFTREYDPENDSDLEVGGYLSKNNANEDIIVGAFRSLSRQFRGTLYTGRREIPSEKREFFYNEIRMEATHNVGGTQRDAMPEAVMIDLSGTTELPETSYSNNGVFVQGDRLSSDDGTEQRKRWGRWDDTNMNFGLIGTRVTDTIYNTAYVGGDIGPSTNPFVAVGGSLVYKGVVVAAEREITESRYFSQGDVINTGINTPGSLKYGNVEMTVKGIANSNPTLDIEFFNIVFEGIDLPKWTNIGIRRGQFDLDMNENNHTTIGMGSFFGDQHGEAGGVFQHQNSSVTVIGAFGATKELEDREYFVGRNELSAGEIHNVTKTPEGSLPDDVRRRQLHPDNPFSAYDDPTAFNNLSGPEGVVVKGDRAIRIRREEMPGSLSPPRLTAHHNRWGVWDSSTMNFGLIGFYEDRNSRAVSHYTTAYLQGQSSSTRPVVPEGGRLTYEGTVVAIDREPVEIGSGTGVYTSGRFLEAGSLTGTGEMPIAGKAVIEVDNVSNPELDINFTFDDGVWFTGISQPSWTDVPITNDGTFSLGETGDTIGKGSFFGNQHQEVGGVFRTQTEETNGTRAVIGAFGATKK